MNLAKLSANGQITVPAEIRRLSFHSFMTFLFGSSILTTYDLKIFEFTILFQDVFIKSKFSCNRGNRRQLNRSGNFNVGRNRSHYRFLLRKYSLSLYCKLLYTYRTLTGILPSSFNDSIGLHEEGYYKNRTKLHLN